jgi:hypothetical protein
MLIQFLGDESMIELDSLVGNEFEVEINGETVSGLFRIDNFVPVSLQDGQRIEVPFYLVKLVQRDPNNPVNRWLKDSASRSNVVRTVAVKAVDDGVVTRVWTFKNAWISEVRYAGFNTASSDLIEEIIAINYDSVSEEWTSTNTE